MGITVGKNGQLVRGHECKGMRVRAHECKDMRLGRDRRKTGPNMPLMSVHASVVQIEARDAYTRARAHTHTHTRTHRQQRRCKQNRNDCVGVSLGCSDN